MDGLIAAKAADLKKLLVGTMTEERIRLRWGAAACQQLPWLRCMSNAPPLGRGSMRGAPGSVGAGREGGEGGCGRGGGVRAGPVVGRLAMGSQLQGVARAGAPNLGAPATHSTFAAARACHSPHLHCRPPCREEVQEQIRALKELKDMAASYGGCALGRTFWSGHAFICV